MSVDKLSEIKETSNTRPGEDKSGRGGHRTTRWDVPTMTFSGDV